MRIFALVSLLVIAATAALYSIFMHSLKNRMYEQFETRGEHLIKDFSQYSQEAILIEDIDSLEHAIGLIYGNEDIVYAYIYDKDGSALSSKISPDLDPNLVSKNPLSKFVSKTKIVQENNGISVLDISAPVTYEQDEIIGYVRLGLSIDRIKALIRHNAIESLIFLGCFLLACFIICFAFSSSISRPIKKIITAISDIVKFDDLSMHISENVNIKELDKLKNAFNNMIERLNDTTTSVESLNVEIAERKKSQEITIKAKEAAENATAELKATQNKLMEASHKAGMAEVATDMLHNAGNVLNSINVLAISISEQVANSDVTDISRLAELLNDNAQALPRFLTEDPAGRKIPEYLDALGSDMNGKHDKIATDLGSLMKHINHIMAIVAMQQSYAKSGGIEISTTIEEVIEDAININQKSINSNNIKVVREFDRIGPINIDRQRVLQILVNLISNAGHAVTHSENTERTIRIQTRTVNDRILIEVQDNGMGISKDNLVKIFMHGFTTKQNGHGFGLHSSANTASMLDGSLNVYSDGPGKGSLFILEIPLKPLGAEKTANQL